MLTLDEPGYALRGNFGRDPNPSERSAKSDRTPPIRMGQTQQNIFEAWHAPVAKAAKD